MFFITVHYLYFIVIPLIFSIIFWKVSSSDEAVSYTDSLFLCVSALTEAGLNTVNLSSINTGQQFIMFLLTIIGSPLITSAAVLIVRKNAFEKKFGDIVARRGTTVAHPGLHTKHHDKADQGADTCPTTTPREPPQAAMSDGTEKPAPESAPDTSTVSSLTLQDASDVETESESNVEAQSAALGLRYSKLDKYIDTVSGHIGRNSAIGGLSIAEKYALGGVEYRAIQLLCWAVPTYILVWQLLGAIAMGSWCYCFLSEVSLENGLNPFWNGAFFAISAFNNSGMALLDENAVAFQTSYFPLLTLSLLILAGNTCYPPFLRLVMWTTRQCIPRNTTSTVWRERRTTLSFIIDHPRRVYTHLFPSSATWWVVASLIVLNGIDWMAFEIFNMGNPVVEAIPLRYRVLDGLFQAFAVRIGGFAVVPISKLRPALLALYIVMMYISAFPVTIAMRSTNVYEEQSLGIFPEDPRNPHHLNPSNDTTGDLQQTKKKSSATMSVARSLLRTFALSTSPPAYSVEPDGPRSFLHHQLSMQLSHDLWWISAAIIIIVLCETSNCLSDPTTFSTFNIAFEVISAYGTVGISTGVPWNSYSFCGAWNTGSKIALLAVMLRGRHRGLPVEVDRAIMLPSDEFETGPSSSRRACDCSCQPAGGSIRGPRDSTRTVVQPVESH